MWRGLLEFCNSYDKVERCEVRANEIPIMAKVLSGMPVATSLGTPQERHDERKKKIISMEQRSQHMDNANVVFEKTMNKVAEVSGLDRFKGMSLIKEGENSEGDDVSILQNKDGLELDEVLEDTNARYAVYTRQIPRMMRIYSRYVAYSSDVGEALRPVKSSFFVNSCYGIAISYVLADISYSTYKEYERNPENWEKIGRVALHATLFQGVASLLLPSLIIHTAVHQSHKHFKKIGRVPGKWGPVVLGLGLIPFLPAVCDHPVEWALDEAFKEYWPVDDHRAPVTISGGH